MTIRKRIIPVLLIQNGGLVKSKKFSNYTYVGDPINAVKIFNDKEVDEIIILDIDASKANRGPNFDKIAEITSEAFMPLAYGGGITKLEEAEKLYYSGIEKVVLNSVLFSKPELVSQIAVKYGNQSVIASIDVKKNLFGKYKIFSHSDKKTPSNSVKEFAVKLEELGVGEIFLNSVDRDGTYKGYDLDLINEVAHSIQIPLVICGGASDKTDFIKAEQAGASAMAAGSMFVFQRPHNAVLISYPTI